MVLESKQPSHHHHHLPSSPHDYGTLDPPADAYSTPKSPHLPRHHVVNLPPSRTEVTPSPPTPPVEEARCVDSSTVGSKAVGTMTANQGLVSEPITDFNKNVSHRIPYQESYFSVVVVVVVSL